MPVKSLVTCQKTAITTPQAHSIEARAHAWSGSGEIDPVDWTLDFSSAGKPPSSQSQEINSPGDDGAPFLLPKKGLYKVQDRTTHRLTEK